MRTWLQKSEGGGSTPLSVDVVKIEKKLYKLTKRPHIKDPVLELLGAEKFDNFNPFTLKLRHFFGKLGNLNSESSGNFMNFW